MGASHFPHNNSVKGRSLIRTFPKPPAQLSTMGKETSMQAFLSPWKAHNNFVVIVGYICQEKSLESLKMPFSDSFRFIQYL